MRIRAVVLAAAVLLLGAGIEVRAWNLQEAHSGAASQTEIPAADLVQPAELARVLEGADKPLILQVGPRTMFDQAHIAGAGYVGAAGTLAGREALRNRVAGFKKDQAIVLYCGCCPWERCPNIRPAFALLRELGFTRVRALYIAQNFGADWVSKGYPTAR